MIDIFLTLYLVMLEPVYRLWSSVKKPERSDASRIKRYLKTIAKISTCLLLTAFSFESHKGDLNDFGLELPLTKTIAIGLVCTAIVLALVALLMWRSNARATAEKQAEIQAELQRDDVLPRTRKELLLFFVFVLFAGFGWEVLYRAYLLYILAPYTGIGLAVIISGIAYGCAHGYKNPKQFTGSIVSALLFASAYALTRSLWWLVLIHVSLPLMGAIFKYTQLNRSPTKSEIYAVNSLGRISK